MNKKRFAVAGSVAALSMALGSFGSMSATTYGATSTGTANLSQTLSKFQKDLNQYVDKPTFNPNGPAFDARKLMKGKSILSIPSASTIPFDQNIEDTMKAVAQSIGIKYTEWNNQGHPSQYVQGMNYAVSKKVNLIDLLGGPNPNNLAPQMQQAKAAGIPVITSVLTGFEQSNPNGVKLNIPFQYKTVGALLAEWALVKTHGHAHILVITDNQVTASISMENGIKEVMAQVPGANAIYADVLNDSWATKIQSITQSSLQQHPDINYIIPVFDSMSQFVVPAMDILGKTGTVKIATFNGTPFVLDMLRQGKVEMDLGQSEDWMGRTIMDDEMRFLAGLPTTKNVHIPVYIWTAANVKEAGVPAKDNQGYGTNYVAAFNKLWGVSK